MKFENTEVYNFEGAMRGMRNPKNSWYKNDTIGDKIGPNDEKLARTLIKAGTEHRKFMRQIMVCVDITAPIYWWVEFDTYKVGTTANACSTMHKLCARELTINDFEPVLLNNNNKFDSVEIVDQDRQAEKKSDIESFHKENLMKIIDLLNAEIRNHNNLPVIAGDPYREDLFRFIKHILPSSYLQKRTITLNYEIVRNMWLQRKDDRLWLWKNSFTEWVDTLPNNWMIYEGTK